MNEKLYKANVQLVDDNRVLKEDKKILQRRIEKAIELINLNICGGSISNANELLSVLKGDLLDE